jgi:hypothetical protein
MEEIRVGVNMSGRRSSHPVGAIRFIDCILQPNTTCKIDVVKYLNGRFIEISELYYFDINGQTNYNENEFKLPYIIHELEKDRNDLLEEGNVFKALKREYRILSLMNRNATRRNKLEKIFNGTLGWVYYCISNLKTLAIMKDQGFRNVPVDIFRSVQQTIKDDMGKVLENFNWHILDNPMANVYNIEELIRRTEDFLDTKISRYV